MPGDKPHNTSAVGGVMGLMPVAYGNGGIDLLQKCLTAAESVQSSHTSNCGDYWCDVTLWSLADGPTRKTALGYWGTSRTLQADLEIRRCLVNLRPIKSPIKLLKCSGYNVYHLP
jgi:hypothetical protein